MSPLDIAQGFGVPLLKNANPYAHVDKIARELGHCTVEPFKASGDERQGMASLEG
ncbi:hypothetical protein FOMG_17696 [Fusarium oxysporum f. sp. melonis 26406]|uniref:Uncharacterized protein n=1 Tax=Fusarium oxysporum f. sp. melonis 26406 TaxID=1089452 RepID=W9Z1I8_FUSOX|nr:hypothetical protein FOMG_17696 [Fusarium oxysporum f. sp. melonis 26406]